MKTIPGKIKLVRACRRFEFTWRYLLNLAPTLTYQFSHNSLSDEAARVLTELQDKGVAITSADKLLGKQSAFEELNSAVERLERYDLADKIAALRVHADDETGILEKTFILSLLGDEPELDPQSVYARFGLQKPVLQLANAYFGMYTRLRYYNIRHTFATRGRARQSQLWHRDREDFYILKVFVYLSDIDSGAGPFIYAPGTHTKGNLRHKPASFIEDGVRRSSDEQMAKVMPPERWIECVGAKGTIVFADTRGYHKGGLARERDRTMYTCMFTSQASTSREFLKRTGESGSPQDKEQAFALAGPYRGLGLSWISRP